MMRSLFSGVSGLKTHQTKMDVIGNNIANVNTVAYKSQSITFNDLMYQTTQSASGPTAVRGGVNARQIGLGVKSAAINTSITTPGSTQTTGNPFDLKINGDAFFVVSDGTENYFTRDGSFYVDAAGNLAMTSNGYNVMGWQVDAEGNIVQDTVSALRIMSTANMTYGAAATTDAYISGMCDKNDKNINSTAGKSLSLSFYDALGYEYTAKLSVHATADDGTYYVQLDDILNSEGKSVAETYGTDISNIAKFGSSITVNCDDAVNYNGECTVLKAPKTLTSDIDNPLTAVAVPAGVTPPTLTAADGTTATIAGNGAVLNDTGDVLYYVDTAGNLYDTDGKAVLQTTIEKLSITPTGGTLQEITLADYAADTAVSGLTPAQKETLEAIYGAGCLDEANTFHIDDASGKLVVTNKTVNGSRLTYNTDTGLFEGIDGGESVVLDFAAGTPSGASLGNFSDITIDFSGTTQKNNEGQATLAADAGTLASEGSVGAGRREGAMSGVSISQNGEIYATYDNNQSRLIGQIAVATFANASGLEKRGDNLYSATQNSGAFDGVGQDITADGTGTITPGALEMSNVDLSSEFTEMITTQRGFQANSRIITVSDTLLEELTNLKR